MEERRINKKRNKAPAFSVQSLSDRNDSLIFQFHYIPSCGGAMKLKDL